MKYLDELSNRLLRISCVLSILFAMTLYQSHLVVGLVFAPIKQHFPHLIFSKFLGPIFLQFKLALWSAIMLAMPYLLLEMWWYVKPALYQHERRRLRTFFIPALVLFYLGTLFAWQVILPQLAAISHFWVPEGIEAFIDVETILDSVLGISLMMGLAFQLPIFMKLISQIANVPIGFFASKRREAILTALIVGMCLTPPDVIAQVLMALPLYGLFELGIVLIKYTKHHQAEHHKHLALSHDHPPQKIQSLSEKSDDRPAENQKL